MQSNVDNLMVDNDFPDSWVELYNITDTDINLRGFYIGLNTDISSAYEITSDTIIPPKNFILIYCDKVNNSLHTNFRLDSGKGNLYLFNDVGDIIDEIHFRKMPAPNVAYGRLSDGSVEWQYKIRATPGESNLDNGSDRLLPDPIFSLMGGVYDSPVKVKISMPPGNYPADTKIYVTTDGKEPNKNAEADTAFSFEINKTTVIRAKLISDYALVNRSVTQSYIYHYQDTNLPIISIVSDSVFFYNQSMGILVGGDNDYSQNCYQEWRRPVNAEMYYRKQKESEHQLVFNQLCETMVAGNYSRAYPQKSLKLYAHKRWGKRKFEGLLWGNKPNVKQVKSFMLRNGGTACLYSRINDALIQNVFGTHLSTLDWQDSQPVLLYLNGVFKGLLNIRERSDEDYVESNYDGLENIELHNGNSAKCVYYSANERANTLFENFYNTYTNPCATYDEIAGMIDVKNFMDVLITEMFSTNIDWPHNNISVWRELEEYGKWRWILKDLDYTGLSKPVTFNMFNYLFLPTESDCEEIKDRIGLTEYGLVLYKKMMSFPEFQESFIDNFSTYLGDFLKPSVTIPVIYKMNEEIMCEIEQTYKAYEGFKKWYGVYEKLYPFDEIEDPVDHYLMSLEEVVNYWERRPTLIYKHISDFFNLGTIHQLRVKNESPVEINGVSLTEGDFDGYYYSDRKLRLNTGDNSKGWLIKIVHNDGIIDTYKYSEPQIEVKISNFKKDIEDNISVSCQTCDISGTRIKDAKEDKKLEVIYNLSGVRQNKPQSGVNIIKEGNDTKKYLIK